MQVKKIMTKNPACCTPDSTLQEVAHMMEMYDCGCIPVVEDHQSKRPIGTITDRDITVRTFGANKNPLEMKASDVMTTDVVTVTPETHVYECLKVMEDKQIRRVLVVDKSGKCTGIVAQADLVEHGTNSADTVNFIREVSDSNDSFDNRTASSRPRNYENRRFDNRSFDNDESFDRPRRNYRTVKVQKESFFNSKMLLSLLGSIGLGAGLRYYFGAEGENKQRTLTTGEIEAARRDIKNTAPTQKTTDLPVDTAPTSTTTTTTAIPTATERTEIRDSFSTGSFDKTNDDSDLKPITEVGRTATNK